MPPPDAIYPRDAVAERFAVSTGVLLRYEARGLVHAVKHGEIEGYAPAEVRRIWTVLSLQRDLGINLAGVEAVVKLRAHVDEVHAQVNGLARRLREILDEGAPDART
jgi:MerR family transcriptional regulator, heat shock protein HspR